MTTLHICVVIASTLAAMSVSSQHLDEKPIPEKRALVFGATGATGEQVVKALWKKGWKTTAVTRRRYFLVGEAHNGPKEIILEGPINPADDIWDTSKLGGNYDATFICLVSFIPHHIFLP
jgi:cation diffusion facilitator CzcD-associated flavoprotein CzcO